MSLYSLYSIVISLFYYVFCCCISIVFRAAKVRNLRGLAKKYLGHVIIA